MSSTASTVLFGRRRIDRRPSVPLILAVGVFALTFVGYALGVFSVSGGVVFVPYYAAVVGMVAAGAAGYSQNGVALAWLFTYASLLGFDADHVFLGLSGRSLGSRLAAFLQPDGLAFFAVLALVLGTLAFGFGSLARLGVEFARR
ncbi:MULTISPECIES: hypothetical protein [Halorussus]|uniref:hypothetical protein n=1 Tax=Halorussus TaxID=1070314 RepID=UPI00209F364D|nr:hypothetical protein [Halorussus vallis]USZ75904.1 hypothetical protein NGM07_00950 [Halorussus vallis]